MHPGGGRRGHRGEIGPGDLQGGRADVGGPHLRGRQLRRQGQGQGAAARPEVGDGERGVAGAAGLGDGDLGRHLGLGAGDQHPPVDEQVEPPERPPAEHVLERLADQAAFHQGPEPGGALNVRQVYRR